MAGQSTALHVHMNTSERIVNEKIFNFYLFWMTYFPAFWLSFTFDEVIDVGCD